MSGTEELSREELVALVAAQAEAIEVLRARVAELERRLSRHSGNSSMPPSIDDALPGRAGPARRASGAAKGKRGKRKGAGGSSLAWLLDPDDTVPHRPEGLCGCGADLSGAAELGVVRSHQVHDVPLVTARVVQHDLYRVRCGCGREHVAGQPDQVSAAPVSYGPNLLALVVYLLVFQHLPVERAAGLVRDATGAAVSTGFVHGVLARAAAAVADTVKKVKELVVASPVAGFDETTLRCGPAGKKKYVLSASTDLYVVFGLGGRDLASFKKFGVLGEFAGVAVHDDRYSVYDHPDFAGVGGHQLCVAHILRDLADAAETYPGSHWPEQAQRALRGLVAAWHTARDAGQAQLPAEAARPLTAEFRGAVRVGLAQVPRTPGPASTTRQPAGRPLLECLRDREDDVLRFSTDTRVWPTNNTSERDLRPHKTQQKISGRLQSEDVTRHRLDLRSYIATARKHGTDAITALRDAMAGTPWTPPAAAPP
ncbi:IS66 family transposase [Frankia tisae]|uniref:IS66 family transposase n=1 Tax=Frankia tisae TaxID=2950104 RepID=UPI0021C1345D|nr:IS66 family transposase [Frankia tisae]